MVVAVPCPMLRWQGVAAIVARVIGGFTSPQYGIGCLEYAGMP